MYIHIYVYTSPESIYLPIKANEFILKALISDGITGLILSSSFLYLSSQFSSEIRRDRAHSGWYGRRHGGHLIQTTTVVETFLLYRD